MDNRTNKIFPSFDQFNKEFSLSNRLIDIFPSHFSFYSINQRYKESIKTYTHKVNDIIHLASADPKSIVVVSDTSIKNQVITLIVHIHIHNSPLIKMIHHTVNILSTEAELFAIRCSINQATCISNISHIIIITDSIHVAKRIFDSSLHSFQIHALSISNELRELFIKECNNFIEFWDCPSHYKWSLHDAVDKETKKFDLISQFLYKSL